MLSKIKILWHFICEGRRLQATQWAQHSWNQRPHLLRSQLDWIARHSPFYRAYEGLPLAQWPILDKHKHMAVFDQINTVGARWAECMQIALQAEEDRDFSATLPQDIAVGLSSGTSGHRGLFLAAPQERSLWAGVILKRLLGSLWPRPRVAFVFRANSKLYESVSSSWIQFAFLDVFSPWDSLLRQLQEHQPNTLIAPARILEELAKAQLMGQLQIQPKRVFSVAEVLEPASEIKIQTAFGVPVGQVYQCTEGLLATTCPLGTLHLHEEHLWIEKEWIDRSQGAFVPILTDLRRRSQPIVRYRLNDVLIQGTCSCGRKGTPLARIEGREDDTLYYPNAQGQGQALFADWIRKLVLESTQNISDWRCEQQENGVLLFLHHGADPDFPERLCHKWTQGIHKLGLIAPMPQFAPWTPVPLGQKFRRISSWKTQTQPESTL